MTVVRTRRLFQKVLQTCQTRRRRNVLLSKKRSVLSNNGSVRGVPNGTIDSFTDGQFNGWLSGRNPDRFGPGSFRPGSFRPNFGRGHFGLGRWVDSALGRFGPGLFRPKSIPKCRLLRTGRQTDR